MGGGGGGSKAGKIGKYGAKTVKGGRRVKIIGKARKLMKKLAAKFRKKK